MTNCLVQGAPVTNQWGGSGASDEQFGAKVTPRDGRGERVWPRPGPLRQASEPGAALDGHRDRAGHLGEEVVALVVDDDERGEVLHLDPPDRLHAQLGVL